MSLMPLLIMVAINLANVNAEVSFARRDYCILLSIVHTFFIEMMLKYFLCTILGR